MKLHEQRETLAARLADTDIALYELERYLTSNKFAGPDPFDKYVNRDDVIRWIEQAIRPAVHGQHDEFRAQYDTKTKLAPHTKDLEFEHMVGNIKAGL